MSTTARISNIESSTTEKEFVDYLRSKRLWLSPSHSEISFIKTGSGNKLATVTFRDKRTLKRALALPHAKRVLKNRTLNIEDGFDGFTVLTQAEGMQVDIVALHGLNGHAYKSWESCSRGSSCMWLHDCLPEHVPEARIMTYGYNANVLSDVSTGRLRTYAETFLERLLHIRRGVEVPNLPLIFIAHSMGGLILKQALIISNNRADGRYDSILNSVRGVVFLGTPHRGGQGVDTAIFVANFMRAFNIHVRTDLVLSLHPSSMVLFDLTDDFRQLIAAKGIDIATLFETKKTKLGIFKSTLIVEEQSAILGVAGERKASINANHSKLCKFRNPTDSSLIETTQVIKDFYEDVVPSRSLASQCLPPDM